MVFISGSMGMMCVSTPIPVNCRCRVPVAGMATMGWKRFRSHFLSIATRVTSAPLISGQVSTMSTAGGLGMGRGIFPDLLIDGQDLLGYQEPGKTLGLS